MIILQAFRNETYFTKWGIKLYNIDVLVLEKNKFSSVFELAKGKQ